VHRNRELGVCVEAAFNPSREVRRHDLRLRIDRAQELAPIQLEAHAALLFDGKLGSAPSDEFAVRPEPVDLFDRTAASEGGNLTNRGTNAMSERFARDRLRAGSPDRKLIPSSAVTTTSARS